MNDTLEVEFHSNSGELLTRMSVFGDAGEVSMSENGRYEYELASSLFSLRQVPGIVARSRIRQDRERGSIEPGNYVGLLKLDLLDKVTEGSVASAFVEVRSRKLAYESEYRSMLEDIADRCADFLLQLESPVEQAMIPDGLTEATLAQRLYFLKSLLGGADFQLALQRIVEMPNTRWREEVLSKDVRQVKRVGRHEARQLAGGKPPRGVAGGASVAVRHGIRSRADHGSGSTRHRGHARKSIC